MSGLVQVICGGQYGSEAKGAIAAYLALKDNVHYAVRTGATNAGHTVVYKGDKYAMQQLPVGWVNPNTKLVIGPGALVDLDILHRELDMVNSVAGSVTDRTFIDPRAYVHRPEHRDLSNHSERHHNMGATGKGCSEALIERVRDRGIVAATGVAVTVGDVGPRLDWFDTDMLADTEALLNKEYDHGATIQLEGTQGQQLDLYLGPYPYVTHKQTGPAQWLLENGLSPNVNLDVVMVIRTCPIRVAGNSGPLPDEVSWPELARAINLRREDNGMAPIVREDAIVEFENAVLAQVATHGWDVPFASNGLDQHVWVDRYKHRVALSELNKAALSMMSARGLVELLALFEMTTVTKKLRRIANLDLGTLTTSYRQIRPHRIALTFMNYMFPERWYTMDPVDTEEEEEYLATVSKFCGKVPVDLISRGPEPHHIIEV